MAGQRARQFCSLSPWLAAAKPVHLQRVWRERSGPVLWGCWGRLSPSPSSCSSRGIGAKVRGPGPAWGGGGKDLGHGDQKPEPLDWAAYWWAGTGPLGPRRLGGARSDGGLEAPRGRLAERLPPGQLGPGHCFPPAPGALSVLGRCRPLCWL